MKLNLLKAILAVGLFSATAFAEGNDVYNFYFQKAPGPTTVIQGGAAQGQPQVSVQGVPAETAPIEQVKPKKVRDFKRWEFAVGTGMFADDYGRFSGLGFLMTVRTSKYFGFDSGFFSYRDNNDYNNKDAYVNRNPLSLSIGMVLTPWTLKMFDKDFLELGMNAGFMTIRSASITDAIKIYWGPHAAVNFTDRFGIVADIRVSTDPKFGQAMIAARYRL